MPSPLHCMFNACREVIAAYHRSKGKPVPGFSSAPTAADSDDAANASVKEGAGMTAPLQAESGGADDVDEDCPICFEAIVSSSSNAIATKATKEKRQEVAAVAETEELERCSVCKNTIHSMCIQVCMSVHVVKFLLLFLLFSLGLLRLCDFLSL